MYLRALKLSHKLVAKDIRWSRAVSQDGFRVRLGTTPTIRSCWTRPEQSLIANQRTIPLALACHDSLVFLAASVVGTATALASGEDNEEDVEEGERGSQKRARKRVANVR